MILDVPTAWFVIWCHVNKANDVAGTALGTRCGSLTLWIMLMCSSELLKFLARSEMHSDSCWHVWTHLWYSAVPGILSKKILNASHTASWQTDPTNRQSAPNTLLWETRHRSVVHCKSVIVSFVTVFICWLALKSLTLSFKRTQNVW